MVTSDTSETFCICAPGQGKTFVMLLAGHYMLTKQNPTYDRVIIYSSEPIVVRQIKEKVKMFSSQYKFIVINTWEPLEWMAAYDKALYMIDEAETVIA